MSYIKLRITIFAFFVFSIYSIYLSAQPKCYFEHYGTDNGLPQNSIMNIIQDRKGFIWMSTWDGLCKFDGYNFFSYRLVSDGPNQVRSNRIDFIGEDNYGYIWTLPYDKDPQRFDPRLEKFTGLNESKGLAGKSSLTDRIIINKSGKVWMILTNGGCACVLDSLLHAEVFDRKNGKIKANKIQNIYEDRNLDTWLLSDNGIYKVDGNNEVTSYFVNGTKKSIFYSSLETDNEIWFGSDNGIIQIFDKRRKKFDPFNSGLNSPIIFIKKLNNNQLLFASKDQGFAIYNLSSKQLTHYNTSTLPGMQSNRIISCYVDRSENVWFELDCIGVSKFDITTHTMKHFEMTIEYKSLNIFPPNFFIFEDNLGRLWIHPRGGGFGYFDPVLDRLMPFYNEPFSPTWRFSNIMHCAYSDKQGNLWMSTRSHGLDKVVFTNDIFKTTIVDPKTHSSVNNDIKSIWEDHLKRLWVSSKVGKVYIYENSKQLGYLTEQGTISKTGAPIDGFCYCMLEDKKGNLWIGTKGDGIYKLVPDGKLKYKITQYKNKPNDPNSLSNNSVYSIFQDKFGRIWVGTYGGALNPDKGGLNLMDTKQEGKFYNAENGLKQYPSHYGSQIRVISSDKFGNIYVGTTLGLIVFSPNFSNPASIKFKLYTSHNPKEFGIKANDIHDVCTTHNGETYIAIFGGGVAKVAETDKSGFPVKFTNFDKDNGLPSNITLSIQEDLDGKLWITTEGNLTSYNPKKKSFETYSEVSRLLQGYNFSEGSRYSSSNGTIYFGFSNGFLSVRTDQISDNNFSPYIALTQFKIDNKIVPIGEQNSPLDKAIDDIKTLKLNYKQNSFTIEFAALDYANPDNITYAYKLDGIDKDWVTSKQHQVTYAKVAAGKYRFHLKSTNSDGVWVDNERILTIVVTPPFWASTLAYFLYFAIFCIILYSVLRTIFTFYRLQDKIKLEQEQAEMRTRFFTDISHEIRTPLTMIVSPIENIVEDQNTPSGIKDQLILVSKNANRMLRMVNQILDFRKIQKQELNVQQTKIGKFVEEICSSFDETAEERDIWLQFTNKVGDDTLWIDRDGVEKLIFNLLSNAFKYTSSGKSIYVDVFHKDNQIALSVSDEGSGMTKEIQNKIFTRFSSFNKDKSKPSTGIGLSIVKEVADKHKARIVINSEIEKGSSFTVLFIKGTTHFDVDTTLNQNMEESPVTKLAPGNSKSETDNNEEIKENDSESLKQSILVVEDDVDLRSFIKTSLIEYYDILEAGNGKEAYELASTTYPDFILSDVMMPEMDGFELLQMIRENKETSHIPFILLTAKTDINSKLEGMMFGAEDYITKPFSVKYLRARIENIIKQRRVLFQFFNQKKILVDQQETENITPKEDVIITKLDEEFVNNVKEFIIANIDNSNFVVEDLATKMSMSRTVFFKKLKSLTGLAPIEFIREIKIRYAAEMIIKENYSIKEIAFMIGFADTKYFTQCFKQIFNCTPSEYRKQNIPKA